MPHVNLRLTPHGHLVLEHSADAAELDERTASRLTEAFARGPGQGLLRLGAGELGSRCRPSSPGGAALPAGISGRSACSHLAAMFRSWRRPAKQIWHRWC